MAINPTTGQEEVLWYDSTQVWIPWVNMAPIVQPPQPTPQVATTWTTPQNPQMMTPPPTQPVQPVVQQTATPQPTTKVVEQKPIELPTSIDEWKKQWSNMWTLEQMIEKSYWTVAENKNWTLQANIWGVDYQWTIDQSGNPIKTKVWWEDSQLIFSQLMAWKKFDDTGVQTTPEFYKAKARYDIANQYMWMWEEQLYNAYLNWDIWPELEKDLLWNPYLALAKDKVNKKTVTDSINKDSVTMLNAYNKANNDKYTPVTVQKTPLEMLSDKFMASFESTWKTDQIDSFKNYMQTNYPNIVTDSLKLNGKTQELQKLTDERDKRLDEIIKENPWISINRATMLATRENKDINAQIQSMWYEIQNLSANLKYQTDMANQEYTYAIQQQERKDAIEKEKRAYLYQQIETQQALEASQAQAEAKQQQQDFENAIKLQELQAKLWDRKTTVIKDEATGEQKLIDSTTGETIQSFKTGLKPENMTPYQQAQTELDKQKLALDQKKFDAEQAWWGSTISWNINFTVTPWTTNNRPDRNNNPWNVKIWNVWNWTDEQWHTIFATPEQWYQAMINDLQAKQSWNSTRVSKITWKKLWPDSTLADLWSVYAEDPNWRNNVAKFSWYSLDTKLKDIDINKLAPAVAKQEWFTWTVKMWQAEQKTFTDSQKNIMSSIDIKNPTKTDEAILRKNWLTLSDVYNYQASKKVWKWSEWLDDVEYKRVNAVIDDLSADQVTKTFKKSQEAYNFATKVKVWNNATDNQALIYAFAKAMDPDSVVREWEYTTVQKYSQTWWDQLWMNINRILNWQEFISDKAKNNMVNTIKSKYEASKDSYNSLRGTKIKMINDIAWKDIWEKALPSDVMEIKDTLNTTESLQSTVWKNWVSYTLKPKKK